MDSLRKLEEYFSHFPGIGPRQAKRFVYYILNKPQNFITDFTHLLEEVRRLTSHCVSCHRLFFRNNYSSDPNPVCAICSDPQRNQNILMIIARDSDFETIEKSGAYTGLYFILGGTVPVLDKDPDKRIRLKTLLEYVAILPSLSEIIISLNTTSEGEYTAKIIKEALLKIIPENKVQITLLGRGLSTGAELEYVDSETIRNALRNRS